MEGGEGRREGYFSFCIPGSQIAGSWGVSTFNSLGNCLNVPHRGCPLHNPSSGRAAAPVLPVVPRPRPRGLSRRWVRGGTCSFCHAALQKGSVPVGPLGGRHLEGMDGPGRPWAHPAPLGVLISASGAALRISAFVGELGRSRPSGWRQRGWPQQGPRDGVGGGSSAPRFFLGKLWSCPEPCFL